MLFAGPARRAEDGGPVLRVVHVAEQNAIPRWAAALYFVLTAACVAGTTLAVIFGSDLMSTCQPCKCKGNVLLNCDVFARAESLTLIDALNVNSFVAEIDLSAKSIRRIDPYAFDGLSGVEVLKLSNNALSELRPGTFSVTPDAPYAANREGLSAADESYNEPGCWLQSGGWEDGAGFALLPGNWCANCFTQYLCSSNLGKYVLAPDAPTPRPVPGAGAGADVCDGDAAAAAGAVSTYGAASPPDALGLDDVYVAGEYGECEGSDGATGARVRVTSKYSDKCDVHGAKKECLTLNDGAEACEMTQEECEAGCAAENAVIMGNCVAYSLTDKGLCRIFGANVHVGVGIGGACWTPAPADRATRVSHVKRPAGFTDSVACWRLRCELTGKCAEPDWFARGEAARNAPPYVTAAAAECFATLWARGYVDACAADAHDAAVRRGRDAVVAVAAAGGAAIVATTLSCLLAELSGVGRTHLGVARARRAAARHRFGGGGAVACGA